MLLSIGHVTCLEAPKSKYQFESKHFDFNIMRDEL
jgi:hypothetical protein